LTHYKDKLMLLPDGKKELLELIGVNLNGFNNWYSKEIPNSSTGNIRIIVNAYANLLQEKFFWRNFSNINLG
jgi:hypothetical protein